MQDNAKKKDNLTDLVEELPKAETFEASKTEEKPKKEPEQQVVGNNGEIITLGQEKRK
jgi:hypothetical protein